jgi:septal ring factor EnvC (AmiA/AmiB activator)
MKKLRDSNLSIRITVRLTPSVWRVIQQSGERGPDWLREAIQMRIEQENPADTPLGLAQKQLKSLQQHVDELTTELKNVKHEFGKSHITLIGTESQLLDLRKLVVSVRQNQIDSSGLLSQMDKNFSHAVNQLGSTLLVVLSQQLRDLIQVEIAKTKESKPSSRFPIPDRSLYPDRNL